MCECAVAAIVARQTRSWPNQGTPNQSFLLFFFGCHCRVVSLSVGALSGKNVCSFFAPTLYAFTNEMTPLPEPPPKMTGFHFITKHPKFTNQPTPQHQQHTETQKAPIQMTRKKNRIHLTLKIKQICP